ncbi:MAG TPA: YaiO family outer membrane beta-barrel protein [Gammaproteobacteria bacterium]|nr:YaiO family outer membrane beta-barrel protein [Gammaproteobacteria bacterium]HRP86265.1 YaiO family outer membrane beta-barrel protein [Gammaproteobacteria bacterium]
MPARVLVLLLGLALLPVGAAMPDDARLAELEAQLAEDPGRLEARFEYARALSWAERWDEALREYDRLLAAAPGNPDYLLGKAQVLAWSGRPAAALPLLEEARQVAPDYQAVIRLEAQVRERLAARPAESLEAGLGWQDLGSGLPDWRSQYIEYQRSHALGYRVFGSVQREERFDASDVEGRAGWARPWNDDWSFVLEGSVAPGAEVLPRWSGRIRLHRDIGDGWGVYGGVSQSGYAGDDLATATVGAERYTGPWHAALTVQASRLQRADTTWSGHARLDRYYASDSRIGLIAAAGRETESIGDGRFLTSSTLGLALLGLHRVAPHWSVSWELLVHEQGDIYTREGFRAGLRYDF